MTSVAIADNGHEAWNPNTNQANLAPAIAAPAIYAEVPFTASANTAYHVWVRLRAEGDSMSNDSIHLQFNDSVTSSGAATQRIGTTSSAEFVLQNGSSGAPVHGWGWTDNGWGVPGTPIYFATTGTHTLRMQQREDGAIVDQIVFSPVTYFKNPPGPRTDDTTILTESGSTPPATCNDPAATNNGGPAPCTYPPPPSCTFTLAPASANQPASGGTGSFTVTASDSSCTWSASTTAAWVAITAGASGTGNGTVSYTAQGNDSAARSGSITVGTQAFAITQDATSTPPPPSCTFTIAPASANFVSDGGSGSFAITASDPSCTWTASTAAAWMAIDPASASGTGNGTVSYTVQANTAAARSGGITAGTQTFAVTQDAAPAPPPAGVCGSVTLDTTSKNVGASEANWVITVTAPDGACTWTATSDADWLVIKSTTPTNMPVAGSGTVRVRAVANTTGVGRIGHFIVNGVTYTVKQGSS
jgi:hypothetical protein